MTRYRSNIEAPKVNTKEFYLRWDYEQNRKILRWSSDKVEIQVVEILKDHTSKYYKKPIENLIGRFKSAEAKKVQGFIYDVLNTFGVPGRHIAKYLNKSTNGARLSFEQHKNELSICHSYRNEFDNFISSLPRIIVEL